MRVLISAVLLLLAVSTAHAQDVGFFTRTDCSTLSAVANQTFCIQTTTTDGRTAGFLYRYDGSSWVEVGAEASGVPFCNDAGSNDAYTCTVSEIAALADGQLVAFRPNTNNTNAATLDINGLGAAAIKQADGSTDPITGELVAGQRYLLSYDGTVFRLVTSSGTIPANSIGATEIDETDDYTWTGQHDFTGAGVTGITVTEAQDLEDVFGLGKVISSANSLANALQVGDGTTPWCMYTDSVAGPKFRPCTASNTQTDILTNFTWSLFDAEGDAAILTVDPDAASPNAMYTFGSGYRPRKSIWFGAGSLSTDGTQCAAPAEVTPVASGPKLWSIICTDNDASTIHGSVRMPDSWDGGTVTFTHVYQQTAADTNVLNGDIACQARSNGEAPSSTYGTEVALDDAAVVGSGSNDMTTSAAATCAGTGLAGGDMLYFRYQLDAGGTTTAVATLHHLGFNLEYTVSSLSD
jgi:phosphatidylethanolamine-binding protein (PEBP) family uncharacterized protein